MRLLQFCLWENFRGYYYVTLLGSWTGDNCKFILNTWHDWTFNSAKILKKRLRAYCNFPGWIIPRTSSEVRVNGRAEAARGLIIISRLWPQIP